ncbi:hypothetical protein [Streptacidiphilus sp. P02-A3a]|uniref:hypothetical protein n=1 Tax=Streptacidiphilus sp. P02-A3a TaxID=2704468 RepID=UPI0015F861BF|nr:hypothetical protein [Streptacidiphilus sp. P02-A3a]QMU73006.1 hypothetical protein GXP74_36955 [Streptacidiphilus sp. P02-A3a]
MPRGRHRQTSPLSRLLPPIACGVLAVAALVSAPLTSDLALLRVLVVATAVGAASAAVLLRMRDRAGEVELETEVSARARDEARFEDRIAELEFQAETAEEQAKRLERRLLAQRSQLARAEGDIQRLLRERARVAAEHAARAAEEGLRREAAERGVRPTPTAYLKAASVLRGLERRAVADQAQRSAAPGPVGSVELTLAKPAPARQPARPQPVQQPAAEAEPQTQPQTQPQAEPPQTQPRTQTRPRPEPAAVPAAAAADPAAEAPIVVPGPAWARAALPPLRPAVSILPATLQRGATRSQATRGSSAGTFSFFSRQEGAIATDLSRVPADLADVVGDEAAAEQDRYATATGAAVEPAAAESAVDPAAHDRSAEPEADAEAGRQESADAAQDPADDLVDLTAEDETEPIDVRVLRAL